MTKPLEKLAFALILPGFVACALGFYSICARRRYLGRIVKIGPGFANCVSGAPRWPCCLNRS